MRNLRTLFAWSLIGHFLVVGFMMIGSAIPRRTSPAKVVYQVRMVESPSPAAPPVAPSAAPPPQPGEPEPEVRVSPQEQRRREEEERKRREEARKREEERRRRAEERARTRRELEEARKRREQEEDARREREREEFAELQKLKRELSEAKDVSGLRTPTGREAELPPGYADRVHNLIFSSWEPVAVKSSAEVSFFISGDGSVSGINIERSSGSSPYDESCRRAVMDAGRMPALPAGIGRDGVRVHVTFKN